MHPWFVMISTSAFSSSFTELQISSSANLIVQEESVATNNAAITVTLASTTIQFFTTNYD